MLNRFWWNLAENKYWMSSTEFLFFRLIHEQRWLPWVPIGWDTFDFSSATAERCKILGTLCLFFQTKLSPGSQVSNWGPLGLFLSFINEIELWSFEIDYAVHHESLTSLLRIIMQWSKWWCSITEVLYSMASGEAVLKYTEGMRWIFIDERK